MYLADYHTHSYISVDGHETMEDMARAARDAGMSEICFTDHCDTVEWSDYSFSDRGLKVIAGVNKDYAALMERPPEGIVIKKGLEMGDAHLRPQRALEMAAAPGFDFIIGSVHILRDEGDFYVMNYQSMEQCYELMDKYLDQSMEIAKMDFFDVMGHIGYCYRYMAKSGFFPRLDLSRYGDKIRALLKLLIENGRGIELNTSGIRNGVGAYPDDNILRLYKDLGGEIITVGSDAHFVADAGADVADGYEKLKSLGFDRVTLFSGRKPEFIKI